MMHYLLYCYLISSILTYIAFFLDKRFAENNTRRIPERWLHSMELLGGWPGALLGAQNFRHKRAKKSYMTFLYGICFIHATLWVIYLVN